MSLSIKYRDEIIATTVENETKTLLTRGKICDSDIEVTNVVDEPTIQSLSATENGVYNAPDGVDGFNPVTVNVPQALLQEKTLTLGASSPADVIPDTGYDGLSSVPVVLDTQVIKAENIAQGATILGIAGTHQGGVTEPYVEETYNEDGLVVNFSLHGYTKLRNYLFFTSNTSTTRTVDFSNSSITIPEGIVEIGHQSFRYANVNNIVFPSSLKRILNNTFDQGNETDRMYAVNKIIFNEGLESIGNQCYSFNCPISASLLSSTNLEFPSTINEIGSYAFRNTGIRCKGLVFKGTPNSIGSGAFDGWTFTDAYLPWSQGEVAGYPWGATITNVHYNYVPD